MAHSRASDIRGVLDWLAGGALSGPNSEDVLAQLCQRVVEAGIPLWRGAVFVKTLHPDVMGRSFKWQAETGVTVATAVHSLVETDDYRISPVVAVYETRSVVRRHLADPNCPDDFPMMRDLRAQGATDYAAFPLLFTDGSVHVATWATRQPGGFTPEQFAAIESIIPPLARVAEIRAQRRTAENLLDTYVGNQTGERILAGKVRRGFVDEIHAAIWLSDMRGFTALSERLSPRALVDLLNRYFDCQVPAILEHGGEVLKFMGDGLLAIFPIASDGEVGEVCRRAVSCALAAAARVAELPRAGENGDATRFGVALHVGEVMYGNIGGGNRLDFTCIGPAVNLAARLEKVASKVGETVVVSADFARHLPERFKRLGEFPVAGFAAPQIVFGLVGEASKGVTA